MVVKLVLEDGAFFEGKSFGADTAVSGEVVFNTGMVGYTESLTDPIYRGQILVLTYPLIGNYGVPGEDKDEFELLKFFESEKIQVSGLVISDYSEEFSHWNAKKSLTNWMKENNVPGIYGIDTRMLTKKLREKGVMLGKIVNEQDIEINDPNLRNLPADVSTKEKIVYNKGGSKKIVLVDCGAKLSIIRSLAKRDCEVIRVPWNYDFFKDEELYFDGIVISNGPGDPKMCKETIKNVSAALEKGIPTFGICLGNQILALAAGGDTYKLKYGHRSQNQPCVDKKTERCYITTQNHGYAVKSKTIPKQWKEWFVNANDGTNEGIMHKTKPFFAVQFHPEHLPGPKDCEFLIDKFVNML